MCTPQRVLDNQLAHGQKSFPPKRLEELAKKSRKECRRKRTDTTVDKR